MVRGGRFLTINSDHADVALFEGKILQPKSVAQKSDEGSAKDMPRKNLDQENEEKKTTQQKEEAEEKEEMNSKESKEKNQRKKVRVDNQSPVSEPKRINVRDIKKNDIISFKRNEDSQWEEVKIIGRAGKVGGKNEMWWNTMNLVSGHKVAENFGEIELYKESMKEKPLRGLRKLKCLL